MEPQPEPQSEDPLQWLWDGIIDFQAKIKDLRIRATRNFQLPGPSEVARHDDHCGLKNTQARMPCSCCKGALTFNETHFVLFDSCLNLEYFSALFLAISTNFRRIPDLKPSVKVMILNEMPLIQQNPSLFGHLRKILCFFVFQVKSRANFLRDHWIRA